MLNGAFNYTWEMTDSHDRLSNRSKGSLTRKHLIGATVYYNLPFVQLWFKGCIPPAFSYNGVLFTGRAYDQGSMQYFIYIVVTAQLRWRTSPNRIVKMKSSNG